MKNVRQCGAWIPPPFFRGAFFNELDINILYIQHFSVCVCTYNFNDDVMRYIKNYACVYLSLYPSFRYQFSTTSVVAFSIISFFVQWKNSEIFIESDDSCFQPFFFRILLGVNKKSKKKGILIILHIPYISLLWLTMSSIPPHSLIHPITTPLFLWIQ